MTPAGGPEQGAEMNAKRYLTLLVIPFFSACTSTGDEDTGEIPVTDASTPIYVTWGTHVEFNGPYGNPDNIPDTCTTYTDFRDNLIDMAEVFQPYGVKWNLQVSLPFCEMVAGCDVP